MNRKRMQMKGVVGCCFVLLFCTLVLCIDVVLADDASEKNTLSFAVLPIHHTLPIHVAESNGYFADEGIVVETLPVASPVERDQLMQAGRVDGILNEVSGAALFNRNSEQMKIVSYACVPKGQSPLFRIVVSPKSGISSVEELKGLPIAVSKNTVIEYLTTRMLEAKGLARDEIKFNSVPVLTERMQLLMSNRIKAATLPDPLALAAIKNGAVEIVNDLDVAELSASVLSFTQDAVTGKKETVKKFMKAWNRAVLALNANPEKCRQLLLEKIRVPKNVQNSFVIPQYPVRKVPTKEQWDDVNTWLIEKGLLQKAVDYNMSVTSDFVAQ